MRPLLRKEIDRMIAQGRMLPEKDGTAILDEFEEQQPDIYQAIFGELSDAIAEDNQDMADLFLDVCFDIIWVYRSAFGKPPVAKQDDDWVPNALALLDAELKSLLDDTSMHGKLRANLQERFIKRCIETGIQVELLKILTERVEKYGSLKRKRRSVIPLTNNFLFIIVRLMDELYSRKKQ